MRLALVLLLVLASADGATLTRVQEQGRASVWLDRTASDPLSVKFSEKLTIFMRVEGEPPLEVELTEKVRSNAGWHLEAIGKPTMAPLGDGKHSRWEHRFLAIPLQPGPQPLPLPALQFTEKGGPEQQVSWEPLKLTVTTRVTKVDPSEIRDRSGIEELPPLPAPRPWWPWAFLALPLLVFTGLVIWRRRGRVAVDPDPGKIALEELKALGNVSPSSADDVKRFYAGLAEVLRRFLEKRYRLPATCWTTPELIKVCPLDAAQQKMLEDMMEQCDLAKFADLVPAPEGCQQAIAAAGDFVQAVSGTASPSKANETLAVIDNA
jgi:hypothetical protein